MIVTIPVSLGELIDKITILEIKKTNISDTDKLANVTSELLQLNATIERILDTEQLVRLQEPMKRLRDINQRLWKIEDDIRDCERNKDFGKRFVELARNVYFNNDKRFDIKKEINLTFGSELIEEKTYQAY